MELRARVADHIVLNSASILDQVMPGWAGRIDVKILDISSPTRCVIGQLFPHESSFADGMARFRTLAADSGITPPASFTMGGDMGFNVSWVSENKIIDMLGDCEGIGDAGEIFINGLELNRAWRDLLFDRAS